jgi:ribokinase
MPPYPDPKPPFERTGAGDAFASTFTVALALGKTLEEALMWGPVNSASVVQDIGAQRGLLSRAQIEEWLAKAPTDYKPRKL